MVNTHAALTVFVGNLPWSVTDESMTAWFSEIGEVVAVRIAEDYETGKRKGFGHVEFATPEAAAKAVEFNGEELEGRALRIDLSAPRPRMLLPFDIGNV
jgi:nucleolin